MPLKPNKAASSTARQTRSVTRARNAAARPTTPNREDVSPPRPSNAPSNSLVRPTTRNRDDVSPPMPSTPMSSHYVAMPPNIRVFCHTASPAGRVTSPAVVHHSAFSFRHSSPPLISTNLAEMQNAFSFRHTAPPPVITTPAEMQNAFSSRHSSPPLIGTNLAEMQNAFSFRNTAPPPVITIPAEINNAFSFRHTVSPLNVFPRHASSPPRTYNTMQASLLASPPVPIPLNDRSPLRFGIARPSSPSVPTPLNDRSPLRFHSARPSSPPIPTPINIMSSRFRIARPSSPPVPTPLNDRSPLRFGSARLSSPPVPTPLNVISPRFRHARLARPSSPLVPTPHNSRSPLIRFGIALTPPISGQESGPRRMVSDPAALHEANSSRQRNAFNITVDLTDSPLAAAPHLNTTVDLTDSPFNAPIPRMENTGGASAAIDNSPAATPGASPILCPVCLDGHARIASTGRRLMSTVCGHIFCSACLPVCIRSSGRCPTCRSVIRRKDVHPVYI